MCFSASSALHLWDAATAFNLPTQVYKQWYTTVILTTLSHSFSLPSSLSFCLPSRRYAFPAARRRSNSLARDGVRILRTLFDDTQQHPSLPAVHAPRRDTDNRRMLTDQISGGGTGRGGRADIASECVASDGASSSCMSPTGLATGQALIAMEKAVKADPYNAGAWKLLAFVQLHLLGEPDVVAAFPGLRELCIRTLRAALVVFPHDKQMLGELQTLM